MRGHFTLKWIENGTCKNFQTINLNLCNNSMKGSTNLNSFYIYKSLRWVLSVGKHGPNEFYSIILNFWIGSWNRLDGYGIDLYGVQKKFINQSSFHFKSYSHFWWKSNAAAPRCFCLFLKQILSLISKDLLFFKIHFISDMNWTGNHWCIDLLMIY